jgi:AAA domain
MGILNIAPAERAGAHLLIQLYGPPRSGKTYTALRMARGMVGPQGRIGVLDTESGRARLYSDKVPGGFVVGELTPPYTPRRYLEAIGEFLTYGVDILVVDSFSHCWEGPGGVLEMADQAEEHGRKGLMKWLMPKRDYKKLVSFLLSTRMHMICARAPSSRSSKRWSRARRRW